MKILKPLCRLLALTLAIVPLMSCALFDRHQKNEEGFYEAHYSTCGPVALRKAFNEFYIREGIVFVRDPHPRDEISKLIQKRGMKAKELLSFFHKDTICITWPNEMKYVANHYGFELITVDDIDDLDPEKDIAIVLVHGKLLSNQYHWTVFPVDEVKKFYGESTVIDIVYLLKWKRDEK